MEVEIVKVLADDIEELFYVSHKTFYDSFGHQNNPEDIQSYMDEFMNIEHIRDELSTEGSTFYFAKIHNETVGYIKINVDKAVKEPENSEGLELQRIYVLGTYQGHKIGQKLLDFVIQTAQNLNKRFITLGVWEKNLRAIQFYKNNHFVISKFIPFMLGADLQTDIEMRLYL